ncbi:hypothetical protein SNEBB_004271 [Seison nebaliae]|nr:hypothetical protein SNEBB_004271 [Seison nebaliae]
MLHVCSHCSKSFNRPYLLNEHVLHLHENKRAFQCTYPQCCKSYRRQKDLYQHERTFHISEDETASNKEMVESCGIKKKRRARSYKCYIPNCKEIFKTKIDFRKHVNEKHNDEEIPLSDMNDQREEIESVKLKKSYECDRCEKKFVSLSKWSRHRAIHHNKICEHCKHTFNSIKLLTKHLKKEHGRIVECKDCDKKFLSSTYLKSHQKQIHEKNSKFVCDKCQQKFSTRSGLTSHERFKHSPLLKCNFKSCPETFLTEKLLTNHLTNHHSDEKSNNIYRCVIEDCGAKYSHRSQLSLHETKHKNEEKKDLESAN